MYDEAQVIGLMWDEALYSLCIYFSSLSQTCIRKKKKRVQMNDSVFHNDKCNNKFFITSLLSQLNALQTLSQPQ